jgi:gliding motility-associated-like protein
MALTVNSINTNATCDGGNDGTITLTASGGNSNYQYSIDGINFQSSNIFSVAPGSHAIIVKDDKGCQTSYPTIVGLTNNLTVTPQSDPTICEGDSRKLQLNSNATQFSWSPSTGISNTSISDPVVNPTITTRYIVTATLGRCSADDTVIVNVNAAPKPNAGPDGFICYGQTYQLLGSGGTVFSWTPAVFLDDRTIFNPKVTPTKTITYSLSLIDANGCKSLVTDEVTVDVTPPIKVTTLPFDTIGYPGDQFQLNASSLANIYSWSPSVGLSNPNIANPVITIGAMGDDVVYRVIASTIAGCKGEGFVHVRAFKGPDIYMPTGFTPNNDGKNDKFIPIPVGIVNLNYFRVYSRWGQIIFQTNKLHDGWDGRIRGVEQSTGAYVWMVEAVTKDKKTITKRGTVILIR